MASKALAGLLALAGLAACGPADNEPGPGGVTVGEARALDEAAEMLEEQRLPPEAFEPTQPPSGDAGASPGEAQPDETANPD